VRKRRAIIFDDEDLVLNMLTDVFQMRGYEVIGFREASDVCPLQGGDAAGCGVLPCADVLLTDHHMPGMSGLELLRRQQDKGCVMDSRNKAVISGNLDGEKLQQITDMGCAFFQKPFSLQALLAWIDQCEARMDIGQSLVSRRREERFDNRGELTVRLPGSNEVLRVPAVNVSESGLCLEVPSRLQGEDLLSIIKMPLPTPFSQATVRWIRQNDSGSYLAGLRCT
jgi:FixJ family two-component response regulator